MITILCATRNRPRQFTRMAASALATAHDRENIRICFYTADADPAYEDYACPDNAYRYVGPDWPGVAALNHLWQSAPSSDLYMIGSDDMVFTTPHWDKALLDHYASLVNKRHVYALLDSRDAKGTPHPIITREFASALGYIAPPIFLHWYVDTWLVEIATRNDCFTHLNDYLLIHDKPSDKGLADDTHNRIRRMGWHRRDAFVNQSCQRFLDLESARMGTATRFTLEGLVYDEATGWEKP